ncbi:MAG: hypothetical protein ACRCYV_10005 [Aeromonas sp.]
MSFFNIVNMLSAIHHADKPSAPARKPLPRAKQAMATAETLSVFDAQGTPAELGALLAKGGEGSVYPLQDKPNVLVKIYHAERLQDNGAQLKQKIDPIPIYWTPD